MTTERPSQAPAAARSRRNLRWILAGVLAICLGSLGSAVLYSSLSDATTVLKVNRTIYRGEVIGPTDLGAVSIGTHLGVDVVSAERARELIGQTALLDLAEGSLLTPAAVGDSPDTPGESRVGLKLAPGQVPVSALPPGSVVLLVPLASETPAPSKTAKTPGVSVRAVVSVAPSVLPDGSTSLEVSVDNSESERIARLAAAGQLAVVKRSP